MARLNSDQLRTKTMVLNWLTAQRWRALGEENKIKIYLKVWDKTVPDPVQRVDLGGELKLSEVIKLAYAKNKADKEAIG
jgi:hypothetical protein